jgi:metallo-beta-lactamase family protein
MVARVTLGSTNMKIRFWGAAKTVTGSMHELFVQSRSYLLDCGLRQGKRAESYQINKTLPFSGRTVKAVMLSHAHIDHSGNLPTLYKSGFDGPIYCTSATRDLCKYMLADTAFLQQKDAEYLEKRAARRKRVGVAESPKPVAPLYSVQDAEATMRLFATVRLHQRIDVGPGISMNLTNAGHMLGSASVLVDVKDNGVARKVLFSGDLGRNRLPILKDPEPAPEADYLILESTYGNRLHQPISAVQEHLVSVIQRVVARGGHIIAPAFAVGRTQQLVLLLHELILAGRIPNIPVFVDSPLAVNATEVFRDHPDEYDSETFQFVEDGMDPFGFRRLQYLRSSEDSKALNELKTPYMVIAASGMCEGGRVLHHLKNGIEDPRNMVLITGFQAEGTLGRRLLEKEPEVPIFGEPVRLRAEVDYINELSGHADQNELIDWIRPISKGLKGIFLVHGEPLAQEPLMARIKDEFGIPVFNPGRGEEFDIL